MEYTERLLGRLETQGPQLLEGLLTAFPEFSEDACRGEACRLLLRLDTRVRLLDDGRWALAATAQTPEDRIASAACGYLAQVPGPVATLNSVVSHVCGQTGFEQTLVRSMVLQNFDHKGPLVFKKLKKVEQCL
jgi:hypothetical protein